MIRYHDEGGEFHASIGVLWEYLEAEGEHPAAHPTTKNHEVRELGPNSFELTMDQKYGAQWFRETARTTIYRPLGIATEVTKGHTAGSKYFLYYSPKGERTAVTVVGYFQSTEFPDGQLGPMIGYMFEQFFEEDQEQLRLFLLHRKRAGRGRIEDAPEGTRPP